MILYHKKLFSQLGFEAYIAPTGFDRTVQPVDIYEVFKDYYATNSDAKYIFKVSDSATTTTPTKGTSYRYGYESGGTAYAFDLASGGTITWTGTKRWLIVNNTNSSMQECDITSERAVAEWLYCGDKINSIKTSAGGVSGSITKWIHISRLNNITAYPHTAHFNSRELTGNLYISTSATNFGGSDTYSGGSQWVFGYCAKLTGTLNIPSNIKGICLYCFYGCAFTSLVLNEGLLWIGDRAFYQCTGFTGTLTIPDSCEIIYSYAFHNCSKFNALTLGSSLTTVGASAFYGCTAMTGTLTIPASVKSIGFIAFTLTNFTSIVSNSDDFDVSDNVLYDVSSSPYVKANYGAKGYSGTLTLRSDTTEILRECFNSNTLRTGNVVIPDTVTAIRQQAFLGCAGLTGTLTIGSSVATIELSAFEGCPFTGTLNIPASVTAIGESAFAFSNFSSITNSSAYFDAYDNVLYDLSVSGQVKANISARAYTGTLTLRNDTTRILDYCFWYNVNRSGQLTFPSTLVEIRLKSFASCTGFSGDLIFPAALATIGKNGWQSETFRNCTGFWDSLIINNPNIWIGSYGDPIQMVNIGRNSGGVQLPANYASSWLNFSASSYLSADTMNQSIINITSGTKTLKIGATNKARLIAAYPNAVTDAAARGITIV